MKSKKRLLKESRLYIIADKENCMPESPVSLAAKLKNHGAAIIQFRDKQSDRRSILENAASIRKLLLGSKTLFIVNDYLEIAKITDSDGVHLGQDDTPIEIARRVLGQDKIIGISCHNLAQALDAQKRGADYIGIGPIFRTPTKPQIKRPVGLALIKNIKAKIKIPFFAIGGINQTNISSVLSGGARRIAVSRAVCRARNTLKAVNYFYHILTLK